MTSSEERFAIEVFVGQEKLRGLNHPEQETAATVLESVCSFHLA